MQERAIRSVEEPAGAWAERVVELAGRSPVPLTSAADPPAEMLVLIQLALLRYVRHHGGRFGRFSHDELRDIAAEKTVQVLHQLVDGGWKPAEASPAQVRAFLFTLARNGVVDSIRSASRCETFPVEQAAERVADITRGGDRASLTFGRVLFVRALVDCVGRLTWRSRRIWLFRTFYEMSSKEIANHPDLDGSAAGVDMAMMRARATIRRCLARKGVDPVELPPGTFTALWRAFFQRSGEGGGNRP